MSKEKTSTTEINLLHLVNYIFQKMKFIILISCLVGAISYLYLAFLTVDKYSSETTIVVHSKEYKINTYFGDYELPFNDFNDYIEFITNEDVLGKTINDLQLDLSVVELNSDLYVQSLREADNNSNSFKIILNSELKNTGNILNQHLNNFINYINKNIEPTIINNFQQKFNTALESNKRQTENTVKLINHYDSLLREIKKNNLHHSDIKKLSQSNIILNKDILFNENYELTEALFLETKTKLFNLINLNENYKIFLDSLHKIELDISKAENENSYFKAFSPFVQILSNPSNPKDALPKKPLKNALFMTFGTFLVLFLILFSYKMIRLSKEESK